MVADANVPLIKLKYNNVSVDISMANLPMEFFEKDLENMDLDDVNLLMNCDDKSIKSINGVRNSDLILKSVPN